MKLKNFVDEKLMKANRRSTVEAGGTRKAPALVNIGDKQYRMSTTALEPDAEIAGELHKIPIRGHHDTNSSGSMEPPPKPVKEEKVIPVVEQIGEKSERQSRVDKFLEKNSNALQTEKKPETSPEKPSIEEIDVTIKPSPSKEEASLATPQRI